MPSASPFPTDSGSAVNEPEQAFNAVTAPDVRADHTYCNEEVQDGYAELPSRSLWFEYKHFMSIHIMRYRKEGAVKPAVQRIWDVSQLSKAKVNPDMWYLCWADHADLVFCCNHKHYRNLLRTFCFWVWFFFFFFSDVVLVLQSFWALHCACGWRQEDG